MVNYRNQRKGLGRPRGNRRVGFGHKMNYFKPQGVPMSNLQIVEITTEELEALRLKNVENLDQVEAAYKMGTSQSTFQRILKSAYEKMSLALVKGWAIKVVKE